MSLNTNLACYHWSVVVALTLITQGLAGPIEGPIICLAAHVMDCILSTIALFKTQRWTMRLTPVHQNSLLVMIKYEFFKANFINKWRSQHISKFTWVAVKAIQKWLVTPSTFWLTCWYNSGWISWYVIHVHKYVYRLTFTLTFQNNKKLGYMGLKLPSCISSAPVSVLFR